MRVCAGCEISPTTGDQCIFLMANFLASLMGIMSTRKYLSDAGVTPYVLVAVLIHCKLLYLVQLFGVWCYCIHTEDLYSDF